MEETSLLQKKLAEKLAELQARNPAYSLRAFSRRLNLNSGVLSSILNGKRGVSKNVAQQIADKLNFDPQERAELMRPYSEKSGRRRHAEARRQLTYTQLNLDRFHVISSWHHFAILSLMQTQDFQSDESWIARRLGLKLSEVKGALERLERLELIECSEDGKWSRTQVRYRTADDIAHVSLRKAHAQNLELARRSLERDDVQERDFTGMLMAADPTRLPEAKERIRKFQDELAEFLEGGNRTEVLALFTQLVPLTKKGDEL